MRIVPIILLSFSLILSQARIGDWNSFTSPLNVHDILEYDNHLIGATDGGLLIYDKEYKLFENLNNIDGLAGTKLKCLAIGKSGDIWIGGGEPDGFVQIYDINSFKSSKIFDFGMSEIIDFAVGDSIAYGVYRNNNDYGIIEFSYINGEFVHKDIYPNWPQGNKINELEIYGNHVFAATDIGLFQGILGVDPNNWETPFPELINSVSNLFMNQNQLYCLTDNILYSIDIVSLELSQIRSLSSSVIKDISVSSDYTIIEVGESTINIYRNNSIEKISIPENSINTVKILDNKNTVFGTNTGLAFLDENILSYITPNAPLTNNFQAITLLIDGRIVGGSNKGLAIKESNGWRNIVESIENVHIQSNKDYNYFIGDSIPVDFGASIAKMVQGPDGLLYCAIEGTYPRLNGGGVLIIDVDNPANFTTIDTSYLDYFSNQYLVVKDIEFDRDGNLWVADPFAAAKHNPLHVRTINGKWNSFNADDAAGAIGLTPSTIAIDAWQRVWVGSFQDSDRNSGYPDGGLAMLSYSGDPAQPDDFQWKKINISASNSNNTVWSLAVTSENRLYMLTPVGLTFIDLQFANDNPVKYESPRYYFPNISFGQESEIRLDANGNAWTVSGSDGIHVLLNNSTFWPNEKENIVVESMNTENYPLLSNNVTDIIFDNDNGIAYISTNRGINSFRIPFAAPKSNYSELCIFPSPYHIPSDKPLIINNLKNNSSLKIMTVTGNVIRSLETNDLGIHGYQIQWDGKDDNGNWVSSGVYLMSAYDENRDNKFGKVVVIRE